MSEVKVKAKKAIIDGHLIRKKGDEFFISKDKVGLYRSLGLVDVVEEVKKEKEETKQVKQEVEYQDKMIDDGEVKEKQKGRRGRKPKNSNKK